ncbi:MAG: glycosyltransferase, partial [Planctomycetaceae bacterium]
LANGVPVVQPAHGAFQELLERTGGGLLVPPGDSQALALALERLLLDNSLRRELAHTGQARVRSLCAAGRLAEETVQALQG